MYDSRDDTMTHINIVRAYLNVITSELDTRGKIHDASKLEIPEKEIFDKMTPLLKQWDYGSDEYKQGLNSLGVALEHHYANNSHHPEHFGSSGINGMSLLDIIEMVCDWKAASERMMPSNFYKSLEYNKSRFNINDQLYNIILNTAIQLNWISIWDISPQWANYLGKDANNIFWWLSNIPKIKDGWWDTDSISGYNQATIYKDQYNLSWDNYYLLERNTNKRIKDKQYE